MTRRMNIILAFVLCVLVPRSGFSEQLVFSTIEKTPIAELAERLLSRAYQELGYTIKVVAMPSRRALRMANSAQFDGELFRIAGVDAVFPNLIPVPYPLIQGRLLAVTMESDFKKWNGRSLSGAVVGLRRGIIVAERATVGIQTIVVNDFEQMLELLRIGRIDVGLVSEVQGVSSMTDGQMAQVVALSEPVATFTLYHYLHKKHRDLVLPLSRVIGQLVESGEFSAIANAVQRSEMSAEPQK